MANFAAIGLLCTLLFLGAYQLLRIWLPPLVANLVALSVTAGINFAANRQLTFSNRQGSLVSQGARYAVFYVIGLAASTLALFMFLLLWREPNRVVELAGALLASGLATAIRYVAMSLWVFPAGVTSHA